MSIRFQPLRSIVHTLSATCTAIALLAASPAMAASLDVERVWSYAHQDATPGQKSEIVAYDAATDTLWVAGVIGVDVLSRVSGQLLAHIPVGSIGAVNGVAIHNGLVAMAVEDATDRTLPGKVVLFDTATRTQAGAPIAVGALPDMLTFTPDGARLLVANEGTPNPRPTPAGLSAIDPPGSISIIDVATRAVTTLPIDATIPGYDTLRLFPANGSLPTQPASYSSYDPEPEYIAVDPTGRTAWVVLQEANGVAVLDLQSRAFERIFSLGTKDFSLPGNEIDPNDQDGRIELRSVPVKGLYQPDSVGAYRYRGSIYYAMANEGDARDNGDEDSEDERRGSSGNSAIEYVPDGSELGRTNFSNIDSARGGPLVKFGAHSLSIRDSAGRVVYDSGSLLDREAIRLGIYDDGRSDNKGVEPEGLALLEIKGRVLAFVGLERTLKAAIAVFDVTDPNEVEYLQMIVGEGDRSPEGLTAFQAQGQWFVAVAHEVSDTTTLYRLHLDKSRSRQQQR